MADNQAERSLSVLTLIRGRQRQFDNLLEGLRRQATLPTELVVAYMQDDPPTCGAAPFPIRFVHVPGDTLALARARNKAARAARGDHLVFLDVDCIPSPDLIATYSEALSRRDACFMGAVLYLPNLPEAGFSYDDLRVCGQKHPSKPDLGDDDEQEAPDHGELWGLSFALRADAYRKCGGFDERFDGYGGEETDFARTLRSAGLALYWIGGATAFHQYHDVHVPPLHHFGDIVRNARLFRAKWGEWCMDYWLSQFAEDGLIDWSAGCRSLNVLRQPTASEIRSSLAPAGTLFS